jgi:hypothetical protein
LRDTLKTRDDILGKPVFEAFPDHPLTPEARSTRNLKVSFERGIVTRATDTMAIQRYDVPGMLHNSQALDRANAELRSANETLMHYAQ